MKIFTIGLLNIFKKKYVLSIFFIVFSFSNLISQTIITGKASSYSGDSLFLFHLNDEITKTPELISSAFVDEQGFFSFTINNNNIQRVFINLPQYRVFLYIEPEKKYDLRLPSKQVLTKEQKLSPFYQKQDISALIFVKPNNDINFFFAQYYNFVSSLRKKLFASRITSEKHKYLDSIKVFSDTFKLASQNEFFKYLKKYDYALIRYYSIQGSVEYYLDSFFTKTPVLFDINSYFILFDQIFAGYFNPDNDLINFSDIYKSILSEDFDKLVLNITEGNSNNINRELAEYIAIKGLFDMFYDYPLLQNKIIELLKKIDSTKIQKQIYNISISFLEKVTNVRVNNLVPEIILNNKKGKIEKLSDYKDKFVYLNFISIESYACVQQLPFLKKYYDNNIKDLEIVSIFVADSINQMKDFLKTNKQYKWTFLFSKYDSPLLKKYRIVNFPTYFLINPDGTLALENTPSPFENFEQEYNNAYKRWMKNKQDKHFR